MSERFVIIHRSYDPVQADILGQILRENGISARVLGTRHGAVIGVGQNILQVHIEVPRSQAGEATDFLEAFFLADGAELLQAHDESLADGADGDMAGETDPDAPGSAGEARSQARDEAAPRPLFAAGLALILGVIGAGHWYGRRPLTALILIAGQAFALRCMLEPEWSEVATGLVIFGALLACDLAGGAWSAHAHARGQRATIGRQLLAGAVFLTLAGTLGALLGPRMSAPDTADDRRPRLVDPAY